MASGFEVTVEPREPGGKQTRFHVGLDDESALQYGTTAERVAQTVAEEFSDSGSVIVRRLGGGERFVLGRS